MAKERILVIEDDEDILELLRHHLGKEGYTVETCVEGEAGLTRAKDQPPHLLLLDLMLPDLDGLQVLKSLRADSRTSFLPVVILTAKGEESDIITGLELGADDYITKPFSPKVLLARIRAVLRRKSRQARLNDDTVIEIFELRIDPRRHEVLARGRKVDLTATEFQLLRFLASHPGWVFTRQQIVDSVKGADYPVTDRSVDVQMVGLRRKLGKYGEYIETVRGVGYRFREEE